jgi:hypothetical protein
MAWPGLIFFNRQALFRGRIIVEDDVERFPQTQRPLKPKCRIPARRADLPANATPPQPESRRAGNRETCAPAGNRQATDAGRLLLLVLLLGALLASWPWQRLRQRQYDRAEKEAREALDAAGLVVVTEPKTKHVTSVSFRGRPVDEPQLARVADLRYLGSLNLAGTRITDRQLCRLGELPRLASLVLSDTAVTDAGLACLRRLDRLESLHLCRTPVTDSGLIHLRPLSQLAILDLSQTEVTDDGLVHLAGLPNLSWLLLAGNEVTDRGLVHLESVDSLRRLTLLDTDVTPEGAARLKRANPNLDIDL